MNIGRLYYLRRKNRFVNSNPNLYTKPLKSIWDLYGDYDARNIIIIDHSMEKHAYNKRGNCMITKTFSYDNVNDSFLSKSLWPCLLHLISVSDVRTILINMELTS